MQGILQMAVERCEYWRLIDPQGRPPGMIGWWPAKVCPWNGHSSTPPSISSPVINPDRILFLGKVST